MSSLAFLSIPPDIAPWAYVLCLGAAMLIVGIGKAGFGAGIGIVVTPMVAMVVAPSSRVLAVVLPGLFLGDVVSLALHKRDYPVWLLRRVIPPALLGVAAAAITLRALQLKVPEQLNDILAVAIGGVSLAIVIVQLYRFCGGRVPSLPNGPAMSFLVGFVEGYLSTLTNSAGVLMTLHLLSHKLSKQHVVTAMLMIFLFVNGAKLLALVLLNHLLTWETLSVILPFLPLVPVGAFLGIRLNRRISDKPFTIVLYSLTILTAARLIVRAVMG